jgi:hypothetical protein
MRNVPFLLLASTMSLLLLSGNALAVSTEDVPITDRDISLTMVNVNGTSMAVQASSGELVLMASAATFTTGDTVKQLLITNGIFPDVEGFGLVYDLNPTLQSLTEIASGTEITLPKVSAQSRSIMPADGLVAVKVDATLKDQLTTAIEQLQVRISVAREFDSSHYESPGDRQSTRDALESINDSMMAIGNVIKGKVRPIQNEVLNQVKAEADALITTLDSLAQPPRKLNAEDMHVIKLIDEDLRVRRRTLTDVRGSSEPPTRWREATVVVRTIGSNGQAISQLRIYYVPEALRRRPQFVRSFDTLSSPSQRNLPEANYVIWAGNPGDAAETTARSDIKKLAVRKSSDPSVTVDLAIIR